MFELQSNDLRVSVLYPGEAPNDTCRFDRAGFISEVIYKGSHYYCASEPNILWHPSSGGRGFCSELQMDVSQEAVVGGKFPKLGIGLFTKFEDDQYWFYKKYEHIPFDISVQAETDRIIFTTHPMECLGYAAEMRKEITVSDNHMTIAMQMTNTGAKTMKIREYCHNFISIGGMAIGPSYELLLPQVKGIAAGPLKSAEGDDNYEGIDGGIRIQSYKDTFATVKFGKESIDPETPFSWTIRHLGDQAAVSCQESFIPPEIAVWCVDHMISPEVFHDFKIMPGETHEWTRRYTFFTT